MDETLVLSYLFSIDLTNITNITNLTSVTNFTSILTWIFWSVLLFIKILVIVVLGLACVIIIGFALYIIVETIHDCYKSIFGWRSCNVFGPDKYVYTYKNNIWTETKYTNNFLVHHISWLRYPGYSSSYTLYGKYMYNTHYKLYITEYEKGQVKNNIEISKNSYKTREYDNGKLVLSQCFHDDILVNQACIKECMKHGTFIKNNEKSYYYNNYRLPKQVIDLSFKHVYDVFGKDVGNIIQEMSF